MQEKDIKKAVKSETEDWKGYDFFKFVVKNHDFFIYLLLMA